MVTRTGQMGLWGETDALRPVNVASVPHRSPFRYPGGKTWFVPTARHWLRSVGGPGKTLVEPFAGGAIVSLTAAFEQFVDAAEMYEIDAGVASVWRTALRGDCKWLCDRILEFEVNEGSVREVLASNPRSLRELAFQTVLRNRMQHGGIMAPGASLIRKGENGKGLASRWYPETLVKRLRAIRERRNMLNFHESDGIGAVRLASQAQDQLLFVDPPYTSSKKSAGNRLYNHHVIEHDTLFSECGQAACPVVLTYDDAVEVRDAAQQSGLACFHVPMKGRRHEFMRELVITNTPEVFIGILPGPLS